MSDFFSTVSIYFRLKSQINNKNFHFFRKISIIRLTGGKIERWNLAVDAFQLIFKLVNGVIFDIFDALFFVNNLKNMENLSFVFLNVQEFSG